MKTHFIRTLATTGLLAAACANFPLSAAPQSSNSSSSSSSSGGQQSSESTSIVSVNDGDLIAVITKTVKVTTGADGNENRDESTTTKVTIAGKEVPAERLRRAGDSLQILDEKGDVMRTITLPQSSMSARATIGARGSMNSASSGSRSRSGAKAGAQSKSSRGKSAAIAADDANVDQVVVIGPDGSPQTIDITQTMDTPKVMLGITMDKPEPSLAKQLNVNADEATFVLNVTPALPAAKGGLQKFDVIVSVDGKKPSDPDNIREALKSKEPGQQVVFGVLSDGQSKELTVTLEAWDQSKLGAPGFFAFAPDGTLPTLDEHTREMIERMTQAFKDKDFNVDLDLGQFFAPDAANGQNGVFRFVVPRQGVPIAIPAPDADRLHELEIQIQQLNETIRILEDRLHKVTQPSASPSGAPKA